MRARFTVQRPAPRCFKFLTFSEGQFATENPFPKEMMAEGVSSRGNYYVISVYCLSLPLYPQIYPRIDADFWLSMANVYKSSPLKMARSSQRHRAADGAL